MSNVTNRERAELSRGISHDRMYQAIARELRALPAAAGVLGPDATLVDVGCGRGHIWVFLRELFGRYQGVDLVRYPGFPAEWPLAEHDLQKPGIPLPDGSGDVVIASEVLPQLENPRVLFRECARLARPGGYVVVTAPHAFSLRGKLTLFGRGHFNMFHDGAYPMMLTPVLPIDLLRMARETGLADARLFYTGWGRALPPFRGNFPDWLVQRFPAACSDHLGVIARRPS